MTPFNPGRQTFDRPKQTIHAAELFHAHASAIAAACAEATADEVVVPVVDWHEMRFAGIWIVPRREIRARVPQLEGAGWSLIFAPATGKRAVEERALQMARLAFKRWEALQRWSSRQA